MAFDHGDLRLYLWPPVDPGNTAFRDEDPDSAWLEHAVEDEWGYAHVHARYSPWQVLLIADAATGSEVDMPIADLLQPGSVDRWRTSSFGDLLRGQYGAWRSLDARWERAIKLLTELEARFWPVVSGRISLPFTSGKGRVDPFPEERRRFDPIEVLARHEIEPSDLAAIYEWFVSRGARIEGGNSFKTIGGDRWARLRLLSARSERAKVKGPLRQALDNYEAAEMLNRYWHEMTGSYLPGLDSVPYRATVRPVDAAVVARDPFARDPSALRDELEAHGLWFGPVHAIVEGQTEELWVRRLVETLLGWEPDGLVVTNLHGVGNARRISDLVATIADYASHSALLVDAEGEMASYARDMVERGALDSCDLMMVDTSFEEANFSDVELLRVVRRLAANPPGQRPAVKVRLTARQLRAEHGRRRASARPQGEPGLANTLLAMLQEDRHGPVRLSKLELARGLIAATTTGLAEQATREEELKRPVVRFVANRIALPLGDAAFN